MIENKHQNSMSITAFGYQIVPMGSELYLFGYDSFRLISHTITGICIPIFSNING